MTPLPTTFKGRGSQRTFIFTVLKRQGNAALVEKRNPQTGYTGWEVVIVQQEPERVMGGRVVKSAERMPGDTTWGTKGWTAFDRADAEIRWQKLVTRLNAATAIAI